MVKRRTTTTTVTIAKSLFTKARRDNLKLSQLLSDALIRKYYPEIAKLRICSQCDKEFPLDELAFTEVGVDNDDHIIASWCDGCREQSPDLADHGKKEILNYLYHNGYSKFFTAGRLLFRINRDMLMKESFD